jgi:DNA-binding transcriptional regulator GbsR (MarR family)
MNAMKTSNLSATKELVEKIGVFFEKTGFQPAMGRIVGLLLISDPPYKTFDQIKQSLRLSKGAVSNALNVLISREFIDYLTMAGDRKRYFQLRVPLVLSYFQKQFERQAEFRELLREVLEVRSHEYPNYNTGLNEICEFLDFMSVEMGQAIGKWEKMRKKK